MGTRLRPARDYREHAWSGTAHALFFCAAILAVARRRIAAAGIHDGPSRVSSGLLCVAAIAGPVATHQRPGEPRHRMATFLAADQPPPRCLAHGLFRDS